MSQGRILEDFENAMIMEDSNGNLIIDCLEDSTVCLWCPKNCIDILKPLMARGGICAVVSQGNYVSSDLLDGVEIFIDLDTSLPSSALVHSSGWYGEVSLQHPLRWEPAVDSTSLVVTVTTVKGVCPVDIVTGLLADLPVQLRSMTVSSLECKVELVGKVTKQLRKRGRETVDRYRWTEYTLDPLGYSIPAVTVDIMQRCSTECTDVVTLEHTTKVVHLLQSLGFMMFKSLRLGDSLHLTYGLLAHCDDILSNCMNSIVDLILCTEMTVVTPLHCSIRPYSNPPLEEWTATNAPWLTVAAQAQQHLSAKCYTVGCDNREDALSRLCRFLDSVSPDGFMVEQI